MILPLPDKYIRKAIYDRANGLAPCYDSRVTGSIIPDLYILITTQSNQVDDGTKCGNFWKNNTLVEIISKYSGTLNTGSRLQADDLLDSVRAALLNLTIDGGLNIIKQEMDFPNDLTTITINENVFRKFIRLELTIN